jgi:zinc finger CCCH domain-containing protein 13
MFGNNSFGPGMAIQPQQVQQHGPLQSNGRLDALYDSRFEDKSFVPDGMVPGLRTAPPTRSRDMGNGYISDHLEEQIPFNVNRPPPQHRNGDMFNNSGPQLYPHQQGFVRNAPLQQPYRGNPSPIASQNPLQSLSQQRLPPGLANLGGRPPHDSTQFFGNTMTLPSGPQGNVLNNGLAQPVFPNYQTGGFPSGPQMRPSSNPHHMQGIAGHNPLVGLNNVDVRGPSQAQLLGLRGYGSQQLAHAQLQAQQLGLRQQQHLIPPHIVPHALPPHEVSRGHDQSAHDLMALLMGNNGPHRE